MKIIVVGMGKVGLAVAEQLAAESNDITVVDNNENALADAERRFDVFCVNGNAATINTLREAGAEDSDILIALTGSDELNLLICLVAKKLGVKSTIARIRNPEYKDEVRMIQDSLGLTMAVNPEREAAKEILRLLTFPSANNIDIFSSGKVDLVSFTVDENCRLCGKQLSESFPKLNTKVLACAVERENSAFIPFGNSVIRAGDKVATLAAPGDINAFFKEIGIPVTTVKNVMIIGGGRITNYLAGNLCRHNINLTIIEKDIHVAEELSYRFPKANVVCGDGTDRELLRDEGIEDMDALCCLTGLDEENILLALYAKELVPRLKTITKVNRTNFPEVIKTLNKSGSIIYPKSATCSLILQQVRAMKNNRGSNVEALYKIIDNRVEALQFHVSEDCTLVGKTFEELPIKDSVIIGCINRGGKFFIPHGKDSLKVGDSAIVVTTLSGLSDLNDIRG